MLFAVEGPPHWVLVMLSAVGAAVVIFMVIVVCCGFCESIWRRRERVNNVILKVDQVEQRLARLESAGPEKLRAVFLAAAEAIAGEDAESSD